MIIILHILSQLEKNGTETFVMNVFRRIDKNKYKFDFLIFSDKDGGYCQEVIEHGGNIYRLPSRKENPIKHIIELNRFFKKIGKQYDVVHFCASNLTTLLPLHFARIYGIKNRIFHIHSSNGKGFKNIILHKVNKFLISKAATNYLACSNNAAEWAYKGLKIFDKVRIISNGIDLDKFRFNEEIRTSVREEFGLENKYVIGHVGYFAPVKNQAFLIYVLKDTIELIPDAVLILIGEGELQDTVRQLVQKLNLNNRVIFLNRRNDVNRILQGMDCFMFPSLYEGLPFSLLEAQAAGLPILTSKNVSQEIAITPLIKFLSIESGTTPLVKALKDIINIKRNDYTNIIRNKGYSIDRTIEELSLIYDKYK